jgi:glycosyltransferase involved in cell wall biosynthesis
LVDQGAAHLVADDTEHLRARLTVFHNPRAFQEGPDLTTTLSADQAVLVLNHTAVDRDGVPNYDLGVAIEACSDLANVEVSVAPVSPVGRQNLLGSGLVPPRVLSNDWAHIVPAHEFRTDRNSFRDSVPVIGRHGRPGPEKWPSNRQDLLAAYPGRNDFVVRMLGIGPRLFELVGDPPPNWELFEFNDLDVASFLDSIDFWVYFHDTSLTEGFGLSAAEAMASGAVVLLPEYLELTFGDGAIYCAPDQVVEIVSALYQDRDAYQRRSEAARRVIKQEYGEARFLERIRDLIGPPEYPQDRNTRAGITPIDGAVPAIDTESTAEREPHRTPTKAVEIGRPRYDVVYVADFCAYGDEPIRVADELQFLQRAGLSAGLVHLDLAPLIRGRTIHANILETVKAGHVCPVDPSTNIVDADAVVLTSETLDQIVTTRPRFHVFAKRVLLLCDQIIGRENWLGKLAALQAEASNMFGGTCFASTTDPDGYALLSPFAHLLPVAPFWGRPAGRGRRSWHRSDLRTVVKRLEWRVGIAAPSDQPDRPEDLLDLQIETGHGNDPRVWLYGPIAEDDTPVPNGWVVIDPSQMTFERFLSKVDAVVFPSGPSESNCRRAAIQKALSAGVPALLPAEFRDTIGPGPIYRQPDLMGLTLRLLRDRPSYRRLLMEHHPSADESAADAPSPSPDEQLEFLVDRPTAGLRPTRRRRRRKGVLFLCSNGVGVGHLTRLLAVARRLPEDVEALFFTMSQAMRVVEQFGFQCEFMPFALYTQSDHVEWNKWFELTLDQVLDAYGIGTVVFDGSMPYIGLVRAVSARHDCRLIWIRRGMWRPDQDNTAHLSRTPFADLIIEPDDIASELDHGATAAFRDDVLVVDPIRLLDPEDLKNRRESCRALGLNPRRRYALIQLGAGNNYAARSVAGRASASLLPDQPLLPRL